MPRPAVLALPSQPTAREFARPRFAALLLVGLCAVSSAAAIAFDPYYLAALECGCPASCAALVELDLACDHNATWFYYENDTNTLWDGLFVDWMGSQTAFVPAPLLLTALDGGGPLNCSATYTDFSVYNSSYVLKDQAPMQQVAPNQCLLPVPFVEAGSGDYTLFVTLSGILAPNTSALLALSYLPPSNVTLFQLTNTSAIQLIEGGGMVFSLAPYAAPMPPCCSLPSTVFAQFLNGTTTLCVDVPALRIGPTNVYQFAPGLELCAFDVTSSNDNEDLIYHYDIRLSAPLPCQAVGANVTFLLSDALNGTTVMSLTQSPTFAPTPQPTTSGSSSFVATITSTTLVNANSSAVCPETNTARARCVGAGQPRVEVLGTSFWNSSFMSTSIDVMAMAPPYPFVTSTPNVVVTLGPPNVTETSWTLTGETCDHIIAYATRGRLLSVHDGAAHPAGVFRLHQPPLHGLQGCDSTPGCAPGNQTYTNIVIDTVAPAGWGQEGVYDVTLPQMADPGLRLHVDFVRVTYTLANGSYLSQLINPAMRAQIINNTLFDAYPEFEDGNVCRFNCRRLVNETEGRWNTRVHPQWATTYCLHELQFNKERFAFNASKWSLAAFAGLGGSFKLDFFLKVQRCDGPGGSPTPVDEILSESQISANQSACLAATIETVTDASMGVIIGVSAGLGALAALVLMGVWVSACVLNRQKDAVGVKDVMFGPLAFKQGPERYPRSAPAGAPSQGPMIGAPHPQLTADAVQKLLKRQ